MPDPSPPAPEAAAPLYSAFGGELGDPWAETYPEARADEAGRVGRGYRVRSEGVWAAARDEYVAGASAEAVCARYDLGLSAFRQRARREGWRRLDAEDLSPDLSPYPPEPEAAPPTGELADLAWRSAAQAIRRGRVYEARAWMKLSQALRDAAREEEKDARWAAHLAARAAAAADAEPAVDDLDRALDEAAPEGAEGDGAELHTLHGEAEVQSRRWEPSCGRPPSEAECAAAIADLEAELAANPGFPGGASVLRDIEAAFNRKTGRSP